MAEKPLTAEQQKLVESHMRFGNWIVNKLRERNYFAVKCLDEDELQSAIALGLVKAAGKFDPSKGFVFSTYAKPCIISAIVNAAMVSNVIRKPQTCFTGGKVVKVPSAVQADEGEAFLSATIDHRTDKDVLETVANEELKREIDHCLEYIEQFDQKAAGVLRGIRNGVSYRKMAISQGCSHETIRTRMKKGSEYLKTMLDIWE